MSRRERVFRRSAAGGILLLASLSGLSWAGAPPRFDVSYLWHSSLDVAIQRRKAVAKILGPRVARELWVVSADGGYGVVYLRQGDAEGASATALAHTRLLGRKKMGRAWPVPSRPWSEVPQDGKSQPLVQEQPRQVEAAHREERRELEDLVDARVKALRRQGRLSADEHTAWSVYDFTTGETLVEINADLELQTASLVKPFLALAFMRRVEEGKLVYDDASRTQMTRMIQQSDNASADWVMRKLGGPAAVQQLLRQDFASMLPGVVITEYIPPNGRTYRNKATARDYSRFLLALWRDEVPGSKEIKRLMSLPKRDRLSTGVPLPRDTQVYSKTGSTSRLCGDIGVLLAKGPDGRQYPYTVVGIIEKDRPARHYFRWLRSRGNVIRSISYLVYRGIGSLHGFAKSF